MVYNFIVVIPESVVLVGVVHYTPHHSKGSFYRNIENSPHLSVGCGLLSGPCHHFQFGIVGQTGVPPLERQVQNVPLEPMEGIPLELASLDIKPFRKRSIKEIWLDETYNMYFRCHEHLNALI